jgi:REP element-mobilizing transposase RayT
MTRGNEGKKIFLDDDDRIRFIEILKDKNKENTFSVYAYCLMDNHVHLVISEGADTISKIMQRINISYAYYFNKKYGRKGHLFQDRFKSEVIESDDYLLAAIRYTHNNPVKAKIVAEPAAYKWSSYHCYIDKDGSGKENVEKDMILEMFSGDKDKALELFINHTENHSEDVFLDYEEDAEEVKTIFSENSARVFVKNFLKERNKEVESLGFVENRIFRIELVTELKEKSNLSVRQIAGLLGLNRGVVQRTKVCQRTVP